MQSAARGALSLPAEEMIEILVHLSHDEKFGAQARQTLEQWDVDAVTAAIAQPSAAPETVKWVLGPENPRATQVLARLANGAVEEKGLEAVVAVCPAPVIPSFLAMEQVRGSEPLLQKLLVNPELHATQAVLVRSHISQIHGEAKLQAKEEAEEKSKAKEEAMEQAKAEKKAEAETQSTREADEEEVEKETSAWVQQHAAEIAAEEGTEFALVGGLDGNDESGEAKKIDLEALKASVQKGVMDESRLSTIQKLTRMPVSLRVQQAMKGTREERAILIHDASRLVCLAVLASPKLSLQEVEGFASMKNIKEEVLRELVRNRKFRKNYAVRKNLCNNAKAPIDLTLTLINDLHVNDLRGVAMNKNVPDTIRKLAQIKFQERVSGRR